MADNNRIPPVAKPALKEGSSAGEYLRFIGAWVRQPRQTASVIPSSRYLGRLMVRDIDPAGGRVLELGGGTGIFTRAILMTGLPRDQLEVVEINPGFARGLRAHFPGVSILEVLAQSVSSVAAGAPGEYQRVISGLPLLAMGRDLHVAILSEAFRMLRPDGAMIQFTYATRPPVSRGVLDELGLTVERVGRTYRNFPPATVFRFRRRD